MFTGIVEEVGKVELVRQGELVICAQRVLDGTRPGDSIAVNGACLTATAIDGEAFSVDIMPETLRRTNLGAVHAGDEVNLERALEVGGRLGGHFVQGHIDGTGRVLSLIPEDKALLVRFAAAPELMRYIVEKGFIAVDGVSLTVIDRDTSSFAVSLVAYTRQHTTIGRKVVGDIVNLETDILAKYLEQLRGRSSPAITLEFLAEHGFLTPQGRG